MRTNSSSTLRVLVLSGVAFGLIGCPTPESEDAFRPDSRIRRDGGPEVIPDAYVMDSGPVPDTGPRPDSGVRDAGRDAWRRTDAGPVDPITVDGRLTESAWSFATDLAPAATGTSTWEGVNFEHFYVVRSDTTLSLGFSGTFPVPSTAVVLYLDTDYGVGIDGVSLTALGLNDSTAGLGSVLSNPLISVDGTFHPDFGWGAARRPEGASTGSGTIGWRTLSATGTHPRLTAGRSACTTSACETSISLAALGVADGAELGFAVRVGDVDSLGNFALGLTIPSDEPGFVSNVGLIAAP